MSNSTAQKVKQESVCATRLGVAQMDSCKISNMENYVPLDVQSSYSIDKSICPIPNLVRKARELGLPALALTDDGFMFGAKEFYNECRRLGGSYGDLPPIKPVIGLSIDVSENGVRHTIRLLAKNAIGYHHLVRIASEGAVFEKPADHSADFQAVKKWQEGLICLTEEADAAFVERCLELFGEDFAFEATGDDCDFSAWPSVTVCAANPVRQLEAEDAGALDAWRAICSGTTVDKLAPFACEMPRHLMSPDEMATRFCKHPEWLENTVKLAERIETFDLDRPPAIRAFPIPEGFADALDYLRHRVMEGAKARWGDPLPEDIVARLDYELSVIGRRQMAGCDAASYLLIVADYVEEARRMGIFVGPGRGGAAGCAVAYALGISDVDPLKHGLLFERFLNPDKENLPDIDIDFDEEGVAKVLEYLIWKYGEDRVARIATFTVTARKSGYVRSVGTHACGIVISPEAMTDFAPVMRLDGAPVHLVTQYGGWCVEESGLVEFDILGLKTLSDQKRCLELVSAKTGEGIDLSAIPEDDGKTLAVFANGDTADIFQFGCDGIREVLRKLKPSRFSDIAALNALFHPGMMDLLPAFIRRKNGEEPVSYDHPLMVDVLEETYGMLVYQEQIMQLAQKLAGFTPGESDTLRKALGKKKQQLIDEFREKFIAGCLDNPLFRIGEWEEEDAAMALAGRIFREWEKLALYAFCRAHVLCYALLAYRSAYLKAHWPEEFGKVLRNNCALRP